MEFTVPQFIEREPKIIGPLTFKQFIFVAIAGAACFFLYFLIGKKNFPLFIFIAIVLFGGASAFAFLKIKGYPLLTFIKNFFFFTTTSKFFVWKRKLLPPRIKKVEKVEEEEVEKEPSLSVREKSSLQKLMTQIETKTK